MTRGYSWQTVLDHRVELGGSESGGAGAPGVWDASRFDEGLWHSGFGPTSWDDVTPFCLSVHATTGAQGLDLAAGVGTVELELYDGDGRFTPTGTTDWLLGRHVRGFVTPAGGVERPVFYGIIDHADAGGTFSVPTLALTAYDTRSLMGAAATATPLANVPQTAEARFAAVLEAAGLPPEQHLIGGDLTPLLADETLELGDLFNRTAESTAGLAWADGAGRIVTRHRDWTHGVGTEVAAYIYAGEPASDPFPGVPVCQTTDLAATQALSTVANHVTYANRAEPPVEVTVIDALSVARYGTRKLRVADLASDLALLEELAPRALELYATPPNIVEGATVTVYDEQTAQAAGLAIGDVVVVGRNDPESAQWELIGIVAGVDLTFSAGSFDVALTVTDAAGLAGTDGLWNTAVWDVDRWAAPSMES